jgi:TraM recognition site of TraD and TraG/Helicase HerA, central domain
MSIPEHVASPLGPVEQLLDGVLALGVALSLGVALALAAALLLPRLRLHYSWAGALLPVSLLGHTVLGVPRAALQVGAAGALLLGRRRHRAELDAGRDLREQAAARTSPLRASRAVIARLAPRRSQASPVRPLDGDELILGRDRSNRSVSIPLGGAAGGAHTLVLGATGSGKTVTQCWICAGAIQRGMGAVIVDPKGDDALRETAQRAAGECGRELIEWTPEGPSIYNPFARGSDTEIADKVLAGERFTEPHYLRQAQRYLGHAVRCLVEAGVPLSLSSIVEQLDPARLEVLARTLPPERAQPTHDYLDSLSARQRQDLSGVRDRVAILAESDLGAWLDPAIGHGRPFDLLDAVRSRAVVYFSLDADSRPLLTQMLGAAIVADLQSTVAALQGRRVSTLALIDEFSAISAEQVTRLFGRARSAGMSLLLGTQELADLRLSARERVLERVMGNLTVLIAHRQVLPDSCALLAGLAGTRGAWRTSHHSDGSVTRTRTGEPVVSGELLMSLPAGQAAVTVLTRSAGARIVRVLSPAGA